MDFIPREIPFQPEQVMFAAFCALLWTFVAWGGLSRRMSFLSPGCGCRLQRLRRFSLVTAVVSQAFALSMWWGTGILFLPTVGASVVLTALYLGTECRERTEGGTCFHERRVFGRVLEIEESPASLQAPGSH